MGFEKVGDILRDARKNGYGVCAYNCYHFESIKYAIDVAEEESLPVIIMLYPGMASFIPVSTFAAITLDLAKKARVPVGLHLDHSEDFEMMVYAMQCGFPSIICDASKYPYEKNVAMTRDIMRVARAVGAEVEAELGHVGSGAKVEDYQDPSKYTDPDEAARFVADTEIDYLAVAIGNSHGQYAQEPKLDISLLERIADKVSIPLVMHGGSGIPDDQLAKTVKRGMVKFNIGTYYMRSFFDAAAEHTQTEAGKKARSGLWLGEKSEPGVKEFLRGRFRALNPDGKKV